MAPEIPVMKLFVYFDITRSSIVAPKKLSNRFPAIPATMGRTINQLRSRNSTVHPMSETTAAATSDTDNPSMDTPPLVPASTLFSVVTSHTRLSLTPISLATVSDAATATDPI